MQLSQNSSSIVKGKILGSRYKIIEYLAEGGFGRTYLAEDTQLPGKDICVVKQLYPSSQNPNFLKIARRLFKTEGSTLHNLGHHEQIPSLLAYFEQEEKFYLVQQYIKGKTLAEEFDSGQIWSEIQVVELLQDVLGILQFIHDRQVIHRDIKPDNLIRRDRDGKLVLVDFGTVKKLLQEQQTNINQLTVVVGTQGYMPTEQARGKPLPTSDLYAVGMIGIQALTGTVPIELEEDDEGEIVWQPKVNVSRDLINILTQMTRYSFHDRYQSATEVLHQLDKLPAANITKPQSVTAIYSGTKNTKLPSKADVNSSVAQAQIAQSVRNEFDSLKGIRAVSMTELGIAKPEQSSAKFGDRNPTHKLTQSSNRKIGAIAVLTILIAIAGSYVYFTRLNSELENYSPTNTQPNSSQDRELESLPVDPTKRVDQGSGFREDL